eukprot:1416318-Lingulodinium_polyedra.AAC.1
MRGPSRRRRAGSSRPSTGAAGSCGRRAVPGGRPSGRRRISPRAASRAQGADGRRRRCAARCRRWT